MAAQRAGSSGTRWAVFFLVIAFAEFLWLLREYESNLYLRQFLAESPLLMYGGIVGIISIASIAAFIVGRLVSAPALSRTGRVTKTLQGWAPVLVGGFLLVIWASIIGGRVGYTSTFSQFFLVGTLLVISISLMVRNPVLLRMAIRNIGRRKANFAIVISGLMIGTAMISGSLVTGDTLTDLFTKGSYYSYGYADEVVYSIDLVNSGNRPHYNYFNHAVYVALQESLESDSEAGPLLKGVTPEIVEPISVFNYNSLVRSSGVTLVGTHPNASQVLGNFHDKNGRVISSGLADTEMILDERAAKDLNASIGDIMFVLGSRLMNFTVTGIAVEDERGLFGTMQLFVNLNAAQTLMDRPQQLNYLAITNTGGLRPSIQHSETVGLAANRTLNTLQAPAGPGCKSSPAENAGAVTILCAYAEKKAGVDSAIESAKNLSTFFLTMSTFSIIAGIVLILNIFVMLAEERKSEMGMARAVGMKRSHLTKLFLFEGSNYAAAAALIGVFAGVGIAYAILYAFGQIITGFFSVDLSIVLASFTFTILTLVSAFTAGLLITYGTIILTSWRTSKLNIIRAIRDIPEPPRGIRTYAALSILGTLLAVLGAILNQVSFSMKSAVFYLTGTSLVIFGIGLVLSRFLKNRVAFTLTGLALLVQWGIPQLSWTNPVIKTYVYGPELFFTGGIIMVLGAILLFTYNTDLILKSLRVFYGLKKSLVPIFRIGLSYPNNKRFRTTAAVSMFALVIFTVTTISVITAEQTAALETQLDEFTGGYDIVTDTDALPPSNFAQMVKTNGNLTGQVEAVIPFVTSFLSVTDLDKNIPAGRQRIVGANASALGPDNFFTTNKFSMINMTVDYNNESEVWAAVGQNSSKVVWSSSFVSTTGPPAFGPEPEPGDTLLLADGAGRTARVEVVAILNGVYFEGIVSSDRLLQDRFGITTGTLAFIKVTETAEPTQVSIILRRDYLQYKLQTLVIPVLVADFLEVGNAFLALFQGFLGLGLVVGIAGLGIISIRSVVERRREIGMLRALGFRRSMVLQAFLLENSYITLVGIVIGVVLGINLGYAISQSPGSQLPFVIPWVGILEIVGIAYGLAMLATVGSAFRAARIPPAEALRYTE